MKQSKLVFWGFLTPSLVTFSFTVVFPMISGVGYSFTDWNGIGKDAHFVGLQNYRTIFTSGGEFFRIFLYTLLFTLAAVVVVNALGFLLAFLTTRGFKGSNFLRSIFFMPNLVGGVLIGFVWQFIFTQVFNAMGNQLHLPFLKGWLSTQATATLGMLIVVVWQMAGYMMLIYIAQLQNIPDNLLEASRIDGASVLQRLRYIVIPLMAPAFTIGIFLTLSNCFRLYDLNLTLTSGGPAGSSEMIALNIVKTAFTQNKLGLAQAKAVIFMAIVAFITLMQLYLSKKREVEM